MPPYFESHEDIKVTGLVGGGVGAGRADSTLLSSLDALARTSGDSGDRRDGASSPPPFLKLHPDPDEDVIFSGGAGFSSSPSSNHAPSAATPPPRSSESSPFSPTFKVPTLSPLSPVKSQSATSPLLARSNSLKRMGSVKRLEVGKQRKSYSSTRAFRRTNLFVCVCVRVCACVQRVFNLCSCTSSISFLPL